MIRKPNFLLTDDNGKELQEKNMHLLDLTVNDGDIHQFVAGHIPSHWHKELEIFVLLEGDVSVCTSGNTCRLQAGDGCFINTHPDIVGGTPGSIFDTAYIRPFTVGNFSSIRISVLNYDTGNYGQILEESILSEKSPLGSQAYFENVDAYITSAKKMFEKNQLYAYIIIPEDFNKQLENGQTPEINFYFNNYNTDIAKNLRLYLSEGILSFYRATDPTLQIGVTELQNVPKQLPWFEIIASGVFAVLFSFPASYSQMVQLRKMYTPFPCGMAV